VPGTLALTSPNITASFPIVTLDGNTAVAEAIIDKVVVEDTTGSGAGYHVLVAATQLQEIGGAGYTLPAGSLQLKMPTSMNIISGNNSLAPTPSLTDAVIDSGSSTSILSAAAGKGAGKYELIFPAGTLRLTLDPAYAKVDSANYPSIATPYQSVITWTIVVGP
jgi:hypothetical protein